MKQSSNSPTIHKIRLLKKSLYIACGFLVTALVFFATNYAINNVKDSVEKQYIQDGKRLVKSYSTTIDYLINQAFTTLDMYSELEVIKNGSFEEIVSFLKNNTSIRPKSFIHIIYSDINGNGYTDEGKYVFVGDRKYTKAIVDTHKLYFLDTAVISKATGKMVFHVAKGIYTDGKLKGFICGAIELSVLQKLLSDIIITETTEPFILDNYGILLSHPKDELLMKRFNRFIPNISLHDMQSDYPTCIKTESRYKEETRNVHIFSQKVKSTSWTIAISIDDTQIFNLYNKLERGKELLYTFIIIIVLIFYISAKIYSFLTNKKLDKLTRTDTLTGLYSRQYFEQLATKMMEKNPDNNFILIEADFKKFKFLNKNYGEIIGNNSLKYYAKLLEKNVSSFNGLIARGYADHFYFFTKITSLEKSTKIVEQTINVMKNCINTQIYPFTVKYGLSFVTPKNAENIISGKKTIQTLIGEATLARNTIKHNAEQDFAVYSSDLAEKILKEERIEKIMESALKNDEFFVVYQPKISLIDDKIIGAEALVRWNSKDFNKILPPNDFIPVFENNGFIKKLDFQVYEIVFKFLEKQIKENKKVVPISVNMSRNHINADEFMVEFMKRFNKYKIPTSLIEIELVERSVNAENPLLKEIADKLHKEGFSVAMDDFGTGESSLNMLNTVPIDVLKFDQNFLRANQDIDHSKVFISSLIRMARQLKKKTIFEGVETKEQRDFLRAIKCDCAQGYFYSKPLMEEDFIKFMNNNN